MKPNSIIRTLFAAFLLTLFCFGHPVWAAGSNGFSVNSYRKNLSRLRAEPVVEPLQADIAAPAAAPIAAPTIESPVSDQASPLAKPSPYAVIAAARNPNRPPVMIVGSIKVAEARAIEAVSQVGPAIGRQVRGVSDRIHNLPNRIKTSFKTAISNALDQAGAKAQRTAEQLRQL